MKWTSTIAAAVLAGFTASCVPQGADSESSAKITSLTNALDDAKQRISLLENANKVNELIAASGNQAYLDPTSDGYSTVRTDIGPLLVSFQDGTPKADGTEITLKIGNPSAASLVGVKFHVEYGPRQTASKDWLGSLKQTEYTTVNPVFSGAWSLVKIPLPGIKPDELGYLSVRAETNQVRLNPPYQ